MEVIVQYNDNGSAVTYGKIVCELIRCKNCEHWETAYDADKAEYGLCYGHKFSIFVTSADGYCDKGERRSE